jgi:hypothetical protein
MGRRHIGTTALYCDVSQGTRWSWCDDEQVVSVCTVANVPSAVGWDATQALISEPIRIIDRLIELLGLFAILGGDGPNAESELG